MKAPAARIAAAREVRSDPVCIGGDIIVYLVDGIEALLTLIDTFTVFKTRHEIYQPFGFYTVSSEFTFRHE